MEVNYAFFRGEGCIYVCVFVGEGQIIHYMYVHQYVWAALWRMYKRF